MFIFFAISVFEFYHILFFMFWFQTSESISVISSVFKIIVSKNFNPDKSPSYFDNVSDSLFLSPWNISHRYSFSTGLLLSPFPVSTNFDDDVKLIIELWIPVLSLVFKAFISVMESPIELPNVDLWIVDCW